MTKVFTKMNRRHFLQLALSSGVAFVAVSTLKSTNRNLDGLDQLPQDIKNEIREYNSNRKELLSKNLNKEILEDYKNQKTFWLKGKILTYAEASKK